MMIYPWITDIQKYSIHDGPGIRTTVFFKGCPLSCVWCHNPETQSYNRQVMYHTEKCLKCGQCITQCANKAVSLRDDRIYTDMKLCDGCKVCTEYCLSGAREFVGRRMEPEVLVRELVKDRAFYEESGGGITLSGGEVMTVDTSYLIKVLEPLHREGYSIGIDTCGYAPYENFQRILEYTDFFLYDIKVMDNDLHKKYTGVGNQLILDNCRRLSEAGAVIYLRIPVIKEVNANIRNMEQCAVFLKNNNIFPRAIHLLPYHAMGKSKYDRLAYPYEAEDLSAPTKEQLKELSQIFVRYGYCTVIGG